MLQLAGWPSCKALILCVVFLMHFYKCYDLQIEIVIYMYSSSMHSFKTTSGAAGGQSTNNTLVILRGVYYIE